MDMMFFNKKSELDMTIEEINKALHYFDNINEKTDERIRDLYSSINTTEIALDAKITREISYIERRIDGVNNDINILTNIGLGLLGLDIVILCVIIGYSLTH
jgi:hypothetical protein